ncbi:MAG TPA: glycosyltransferase family 39 protein [Anaerolineaceae bacterium]
MHTGLTLFRAKLLPLLGLITLLLLGLLLRIYDLDDPPFDFHPTRQLRAAIITRGMYYQMDQAADPARKEQAIALWQTMETYEPPIFERLTAFVYLLTGGERLWIPRLLASLAWLAGGLALYDLARRVTSTWGAATALAFFVCLPFSVVASRAFQPDPLMVALTICSAWALERWSASDGTSWKWTLLAGIFSGLAILFKVLAVFGVVAMALGFFLTLQRRKQALRQPQTWVLAGLLTLLPAGYYLFGIGKRSADFAFFWTVQLADLLLQTKFYLRWLALLHGLVDPILIFLALAASFLLPARGKAAALGLWAGYLMIGLTFPYQVASHEYYSLPLLPPLALGFAALVDAISNRLKTQPRLARAGVAAIALVVLGYTAWVARSTLAAQSYRFEPVAWEKMGAALPRDGEIIALVHDYGNRLKYYGWRAPNRYWLTTGDSALMAAAGSSAPQDFDAYFDDQTKGMHYFLVTLFSDLEAQPLLKARLYDTYPIAQQGDGYILFDLTRSR